MTLFLCLCMTQIYLLIISDIVARFGDLPSEFYAISKEEIKREQQAKQEAVEKLGMLRTKAMRERDELRELRKYRYVYCILLYFYEEYIVKVTI